MNRRASRLVSIPVVLQGLLGCSDDSATPNTAPSGTEVSSDSNTAPADTATGATYTASNVTGTNVTTGDTTTGGCEDVYPFDDEYSCAQQAEWGKCEEVWLEGYCLQSCNRCDWVPVEHPDMSGPRNVFDEYTPKQDLAPTPPMGWNSWNKFACDISAELIKGIADAMVDSGLKDAGYEYINIDDCWQLKDRDVDGNLVADPERFPEGIKGVADYIHEKGLKLGIYSDRGVNTCGGKAGSFGHEIEDATLFAQWGVDYLKYDNCYEAEGRTGDADMQEDYQIMGEALRQSGRDIVFSVCAWWFHEWMPEVGHLWRTTTDIKDVWAGSHQSVTRLLNWSGGTSERYGSFGDSDEEKDTDLGSPYAAPGLARYAGPSGWNDPDMLEVGNGGMTDTEYRAHFSLWALMAAPLIAGNDLREMSDATREVLLNTEVIAVNQDPVGAQGVPVSESTELEVWVKPLSGSDNFAVILFNRTAEEATIDVTWEQVGLTGTAPLVRDLWQHQDLGMLVDGYSAVVPSHGVVMLKLCGSGDCTEGELVGADAGMCDAESCDGESSSPLDSSLGEVDASVRDSGN